MTSADVTIQLSERDYVKAVLEKNRVKAIRASFVFVAFCLAGLFVGLSGMTSEDGFALSHLAENLSFIGTAGVCVLVVSLGIAGILLYFLTQFQWRMKFSKEFRSNQLLQQPTRMEIDADSLTLHQATGVSRLERHQISGVEATKHYLFIKISNMLSIFIPKDQIPAETVELILAWRGSQRKS